jgi:SAM-dependent methyltransferase
MKTEWTERTCPLCGGKDAREILPSNIDLAKLDDFAFASRKLPEYMHPRMVECVQCVMLYGNPVLSWSTVSQGYQEAAFDSQEESALAAITYRDLLRKHVTTLSGRDAALDIGAGDGAFLEQLLAEGFKEVTGVEPSAAPIAAAKPQIRERLRHDFFRAEDYAPGSFDAVTCFQVMEHVWDPLEISRSVFRLLKPGGVFFVVVHNRRALSARILGPRSPIFDLEHLQLFSKPTICGLLSRAGFENVRAVPVWNSYPARYWMRLAPLPFKRQLIALAQSTGLGNIKVTIPPGNLAAFGFKPRSGLL